MELGMSGFHQNLTTGSENLAFLAFMGDQLMKV